MAGGLTTGGEPLLPSRGEVTGVWAGPQDDRQAFGLPGGTPMEVGLVLLAVVAVPAAAHLVRRARERGVVERRLRRYAAPDSGEMLRLRRCARTG